MVMVPVLVRWDVVVRQATVGRVGLMASLGAQVGLVSSRPSLVSVGVLVRWWLVARILARAGTPVLPVTCPNARTIRPVLSNSFTLLLELRLLL